MGRGAEPAALSIRLLWLAVRETHPDMLNRTLRPLVILFRPLQKLVPVFAVSHTTSNGAQFFRAFLEA